MSILVDRNTRLLVQGITGTEGSFYTRGCLDYGTQVVAGVTPGKGGTAWEGKVPVFDTVSRAVRETGATASLVFVPAPFAADAAMEAMSARLSPVIVITEFVPTLDTVRLRAFAHERGVRLIGPNCPGVISPGRAKAGILPAEAFTPGAVGLISRSGTLTYEVSALLTASGLGQSTCVGIGGDPVPGTTMKEALELFEADSESRAVVLIGEIGRHMEQEAATFIKTMSKPVVALVVGATAPPGRRMGHAGAIVSGAAGTALAKKQALTEAGARVAETLGKVPRLVKESLG